MLKAVYKSDNPITTPVKGEITTTLGRDSIQRNDNIRKDSIARNNNIGNEQCC